MLDVDKYFEKIKVKQGRDITWWYISHSGNKEKQIGTRGQDFA